MFESRAKGSDGRVADRSREKYADAGALSLARSGDAKRAQVMADELAEQNPSDTMIQYYWLPTIRAAIDLSSRAPAKAIERLQAALPYDLGSPNPGIGLLYPVYLRGVAYLESDQPGQGCGGISENSYPQRYCSELHYRDACPPTAWPGPGQDGRRGSRPEVL